MMLTIEDMQGLPRHDLELVLEAQRINWEEIRPQTAITRKGRELLKKIQIRKFRRDEASLGTI